MKGNNFKPLRGLEMDVVLEVLQKVAEKKMTLHEMASHCSKVKDLRVYRGSRSLFLKRHSVTER